MVSNINLDYKSIIESCGIQDENIKKLLEEKGEGANKIQDQLHTLNTLIKDRGDKLEHLSKLKLALDETLQKLEKITNKMTILNNKHKTLQEEITQQNLATEEISDNFVKKIMETDQELNTLQSQFESGTMENQVSEVHKELLSSEERIQQLQKTYEELKQINDSGEYERPKILKSIFSEIADNKAIQEMEEKLATKKKNVQVLIEEYRKKMEMLEKLPK